MSIDNTGRRSQQPPMQFMTQAPMPPQFTDPWGSQNQMQNAAGTLQCLATKLPTIRSSDMTNNFGLGGNNGTLASQQHQMRSIPTSDHYSNSNGMLPAYTTSAEMSITSAPSPTTLGAPYTHMPPYTSNFDISVQPRNSDRRLSQPAMSTQYYLGGADVPKQRQASMTDLAYRRDLEFNHEMDSARNMVVMSQSRSRQESIGSQFPSNHSTSSSISSNHSFPAYYQGGSVDSSATEYSDGQGIYHDRQQQQQQNMVPRSNAYVTGQATVPNQMMTTFSSKISSSTQKKHKCNRCEKRFTRPSSLQTHIYSHTGEKPFACDQKGCGRQFSVVSNLRRHKKVHAGKGIEEETHR